GHVGVTAKDNTAKDNTAKDNTAKDNTAKDNTAKDNRLFVEAVLYRYRAGIPWRDLPERFGDPETIHTRFSRWAKSGVWEKALSHPPDHAVSLSRYTPHT